jgi:DNA-binding GntR family transcriptional regulator
MKGKSMVRKGRTRRLAAAVQRNRKGAPARKVPIAPTIGAQVYAKIADEIVQGKLLPGERLDERGLAKKFQVSRTPIREAFRELKVRGLVEIRPRRGVIVTRINLDRLAHLLEADCELEAICARRCAESMTLIERTELELLHNESAAAVVSGNETEYLAINRRFHRLLRDGVHNPILALIVSSLEDHLLPFQEAKGNIEHRLEQSHDEHGKIVAAILASNPEQAYLAMRRHNTRLATHVMQLLQSRAVVDNTLTA